MPTVAKHLASMGPDATPSPQPAAGPGIAPELRRQVKDYFERKDGKDPHRIDALRLSNRSRKLALVVALLVVIAASVSAVALGRLDPQRLLEADTLWPAFAAVLAVVVLLALGLRSVEEVPTLEQLEQDVDRVRDHDTSLLLEKAHSLLAEGEQRAAGFDLGLYGYPDKSLCGEFGLVTSARISHDHAQVRFTPVTVTALKADARTIAIYQGTVDLTTGAMVQERLVETAYRDIVALERASLGMRTMAEREAASILPARRRDKVLRDKDVLTIRFAGGAEPVSIVLRDSSFALGNRSVRLPLSHPHPAIEAFWQALRESWLAATVR